MDPTQMTSDLQTFWIWAAAPIALLASLVVAFRLRVPLVTRLADAFRALRATDGAGGGSVTPAGAVMLSSAASYGAAAAVGAATAISLGGAGAVAWVWIFA